MSAARSRGAAIRATALRGAALGFVLLDAALVQARSGPVDGIRVVSSPTPETSGDAQALGRTRLAAGDVAGALGAFRQALAQNPQSIDALNAIGVCYDRLGQFGLSRTYYELALSVAPGSAMILNNLGYSLFLQGELQAARVPLMQAAASSDTLASAAARHTLALIEATADRPAPVATVATAQAHIEQSDDGEQRLVTRAVPTAVAAVAALGEDAALVAVAPRWTAHDDATLLAEERAGDGVAAASYAAEPVANDAAPVAIAPTVAASRATLATPEAPPASGIPASSWAVIRPKTAPRISALPRLSELVSPPRDRRTGFDSDDGELNAFAARMQGGTHVTVAEERAAAVARLEALIARLARA